MLIQVDKLKRRPRHVLIDAPAEDFPILHDLIREGSVHFDGLIHGELEAFWAGDVIEVSGRLATDVAMPCSRCLMPVRERIDIPVLLSYAGLGDQGGTTVAEEVELTSNELGLIAFSGPEIDLRPDLEQEIIMALPQQPLCGVTCRGLCPVCGGNLNQSDCHCEPAVFHSGLAALKHFKVDP